MPGPQQSLCPKCSIRERRAPGLACSQCSNEYARARRSGGVAAPSAKTDIPVFKRKLKRAKRYIVTAAQNNTLANPRFLAALQAACEHLRAELVVVPYRYKNPTGMRPGRDLRGACCEPVGNGQCLKPKGHDGPHTPDELWWDPTLEPYLCNHRVSLHKHLVLAADVKISATAKSPLSGFEALTGKESCIIASPKLQFRTVAVPSRDYPKVLTTTGAVTEPNYSNTKAGALGEFHYTLGACLAEIDDDVFHLRQLLGTKADGSFIDLDKHYSAEGVQQAPSALGLVLGDTHVRVNDPDVDRATFGPGGIVEVLNPKALVFHDVFDGQTVNPHEAHDPLMAVAKSRSGLTSVEGELQQVVDFLNARAGEREVVLVRSNHHDFLRRWVVNLLANGCRDAKNMETFLRSALEMCVSARVEPNGPVYDDPFPWWMKRLGALANVRCLADGESFCLGAIECRLHGHKGPNGARGSLLNLSRTGSKVAIGHGHGPGIEEGGTQGGTSSFRSLAYMGDGTGNHLNSHIAVYDNGKRCLITCIGRKWRLE